ncbi:hypothetical protein RZS08_10810, partial [Arthrospira platensis SPKY1]|nr:hypothetical protein [Arthrospira platensis SPKY1]
GKAGGVVRVQRAKRRPGDGVLIGLGAAGVLDVAKHGGGVEPAGFGNAANLQPSQSADIEGLSGRGHSDDLLRMEPLPDGELASRMPLALPPGRDRQEQRIFPHPPSSRLFHHIAGGEIHLAEPRSR